MHILIISSPDDAHIPFVTKHLPSSASYTIIDPFSAIGKNDISYAFKDGKTYIHYGEQPLDDIDSVWFRKPTRLDKVTLDVPQTHRSYTLGALRRHISPLYRHWKEAFWVSPYEALISAENKPHQLEAALEIGFQAPDTLITGDVSKAKEFVIKHGTCVIKSQAIEFPVGKTLMTTVISAHDMISYDGLSVDPMIFQQFIKPAYELRVTVVSEKIFAAKIMSSDQGPFRDWRYGHIDDTFTATATTIDEDLEKKCIQLTHALGLGYSAIDLIVDMQGTVWFLEINPNGQWAFIEETTGQPIGKALAELLCTSQKSL
jgi:glutathione synthase/RimK-type ligase-like ATP-grasp enzyme